MANGHYPPNTATTPTTTTTRHTSNIGNAVLFVVYFFPEGTNGWGGFPLRRIAKPRGKGPSLCRPPAPAYSSMHETYTGRGRVVAALEGRTLSLTRSLESRDFSSSQGWSSVRFPAAAFISLLPTARFLSPMATVLLLATVADTTKLPGRCYSTHSRLVRSLEFRGVSGSWFGSNDQSAHG